MTRNALLAMLLVLAFLGIADAWYLTQSALAGTPLVCDISGVQSLSGCNQVAQSAYSQFMGVPLALYGVIFYVVLFVIAAVLLAHPLRILYRVAIGLGALGFLLSLYFLFLQFFIIKALCIYCIGSAVIATLICLVTIILYRRFTPVRVAEPVIPTVPPLSV